ncbi:hypothetical protein [Xylanibacter muris]|uniref:Uncharacterized protein n=1 Tax=Xylanibacter muris TaxID=2736290 RepID=A0ABX2AIK5_9BACT|nr:hypothetical protein [Xylanibacter muris]NPD90873.1 hypothetical protein [Xylanibacter muris]
MDFLKNCADGFFSNILGILSVGGYVAVVLVLLKLMVCIIRFDMCKLVCKIFRSETEQNVEKDKKDERTIVTQEVKIFNTKCDQPLPEKQDDSNTNNTSPQTADVCES